jgi:hypothetical protein
MVSTRHEQHNGYWVFSMLVGFLCLLVPCMGAWSQGQRLQTEDMRQKSAAKGRYVAVHEGRLSVDLQEADMAEVLAHIGQQASIRIISGPSTGKRVSARFSGVELEEGLRRLLRSAALNHIFMYARRPSGAVAISEVRVLGEVKEATPPPATTAEPGLHTNAEPGEAPVGKGRRPAPQVVQPVEEVPFESGQVDPSEVTRRVREVFKLSKEMGAKPADGQGASPYEPQQ